MTPLERITQLVNINGDVNDPATLRPLLSLEDFLSAIISSFNMLQCDSRTISANYLSPFAENS